MNDISPRLQAAMGFATAAIALAFVTLFIMVDMVRPVLEQGAQADFAPVLEALYPFPAVTEVRMAYCTVALLPILIPLCFNGKAAASTTLFLGAIITFMNIQDGIGAYLLNGRPMAGLLIVGAVLLPSLIGLLGAWRWWKSPRPSAA